jgi:hypothetical protein
MKTPGSLLCLALLVCGAGAFAQLPPDPASLKDSVKITLGKKVAVKFDVDGDLLKKPVIVEKLDTRDAGIKLDFSRKQGMIMLAISNGLKKSLHCRCLARLKGKSTYFETSIVTIGAGLDDFESWEDPIEELVLFDFKLVNQSGQSQ